MRRLLLALLLVSGSAFAESRSRPVPVPVPTPAQLPLCNAMMEYGTPCLYVPRPIPPPCPGPVDYKLCEPTTAVGEPCAWPGAVVLTLEEKQQAGNAIRVRPARQVAIIEGPLLVSLDPRAIRVAASWSISESWWICEAQTSAGMFSATLIADSWCTRVAP